MSKIVDNAPEQAAKLVRQFIRDKSLMARAKVRMELKKMLDTLSVDTEYPQYHQGAKQFD